MDCQTDFRSVGAAEFRLAMKKLVSSVSIVATGTDEAQRGLTVSSVTPLCMEPPCLLVGINSETHDPIIANGALASACGRGGLGGWRCNSTSWAAFTSRGLSTKYSLSPQNSGCSRAAAGLFAPAITPEQACR
jgi:hypothetical protein